MNRLYTCLGCGEEVDSVYDDARTPPLDTIPCLCSECTIGSFQEVLEELKVHMEDTGIERMANAIASLDDAIGEL